MKTIPTRLLIIVMLLIGIIILTGFTLANKVQNVLDATINEHIELVTTYVETHDIFLLAPDAVLHIAEGENPLIGHEAIGAFLNRVYFGREVTYNENIVTLGVDTMVQAVVPLSENVILVEYRYHGTAFYGDYYPLETMMDWRTISSSMVSIFEIEDGLIISEYLYDAAQPEPVQINFVNQ